MKTWMKKALGRGIISAMAAAVTTGWMAVPAWGQPAGLVAAYAFNEGTGTTVMDASGNGNNGTISGATWTSAGKYGNALVFNGTSALVTVPNSASLQLGTAMTLEAWVNPSTVSSAWRDVIYKGSDNYYLEGTSQSTTVPAMGGTFGGTDVTPLYGLNPLQINTWTYLAATYDGTTLRLYVNGVQVASRAQSGAIATSTDPLQIGGDSIFGQYFNGTIDEVRVYNVALTATQIQTDMNTPVSAPSGLVYDNTEVQLNYVLAFPNNLEIGDQIWLANNQTYPYLTSFSLEYYSTNVSFYGNVQAEVRFYLNDGPLTNGYASPGTIFYDTGWFTVNTPKSYYGVNTNSAVLSFGPADLTGGVVPMDPSMTLPPDFTVSVTFTGLSGNDMVGFDYMALNDFDPPAVGTNYGDYWLNNGGTWTLKSYVSPPIAFAMQFIASSQPGAPILYVNYADNQAVVWWSPFISGWTLQTNSNLTTPNWGNYQGTVINNRATNSAPEGTVFFRLKQ